MTKFLFYLSLLVLSQFSSASVSCSSYASFPGTFVNMNCSGGNCSGWTNSNSFSISGNCSDGTQFSANGYINANFVSGFCNGGWLNVNTPSENIYMSGHCSNGGSFSGSVYAPSAFASGSCQENGMASIYFNGGSESVTGNCQ